MLKIKAILSFQVIMVFNLLSQTPLFKFINNNNYIQVDSNDQRISDYTFNDVDYMRRELTAVRIDGNWGYVNYKGELVIPLMYKTANHFSNGKAYVSNDKEYFFINQMNEITSEKYDTIYGNSNFYFMRKNNLYGFLDSLGGIIEGAKFEQVDGWFNEKISVKYKGNWMSWSYNGLNHSDDDLYFYRPELIPLYNKNCQLEDQKSKWDESCSKHQMLKDLYSDLIYPKEARENNIEGKVIFQFVIDKKGKVKNRKILRGIGKSCDDEVLRASEIILEWYKPASTLNGEFVNSIVTLPISFRIE